MNGIACLGDNCVDFYDETGEAFFGGNPVNVAVYLQRLGLHTSYLGAVGTDPFGERLLKAVRDRGVDVSHVQVKEGKTALTHVILRGDERILGDYDEGVMASYAPRQEDLAFIGKHALAVTGLWGHCEAWLERIREMGVVTAFDCADRPEDPAALAAAGSADILFFSDDSSGKPGLQEKMRSLWEKGSAGNKAGNKAGNGEEKRHLVIATRGARGSLAYDGREYYSCGIVPCDVVDTMGAGDSYIAGFLAAFLREEEIFGCMMAGAACSAVTLGYKGAW